MTSKVTDEVLNIAEYVVETGAESNKLYEIKNQPRGSFSFSPYNQSVGTHGLNPAIHHDLFWYDVVRK